MIIPIALPTFDYRGSEHIGVPSWNRRNFRHPKWGSEHIEEKSAINSIKIEKTIPVIGFWGCFVRLLKTPVYQ